jgi:type VI protein secretion system component Hcp
MAYYAQIRGAKSGLFPGDSRQPNRQHWIEIDGFEWGRPVVITKGLSTSSPPLLRAAQTGETLQVVVESTDSSEKLASTVTLTNAQIVHYQNTSAGRTNYTIAFEAIQNSAGLLPLPPKK